MQRFFSVSALLALSSMLASATVVDVLDEFGNEQTNITTFYTGQGFTVNGLTAAFTSGDISGANLVIITMPTTALTGSQLTAVNNYVSGGGRLLLNSDGQGFEAEQDIVNAVLTSLGSSIVNVDGGYDAFLHTTTDIVSNPFTAGVTSIQYAYTSSLTGGTALVNGLSGQTFISYQQIGSGYVFVIADSNTANGLNSVQVSNGQLYCNFAGGSCTVSSTVPEPGTFGLVGMVLVGAVALLRR